MNTINKKFIKTCKNFTKMSKKRKTRKINHLKRKTRKIFDTFDFLKKKDDICPYVRPQLGVYTKSFKSSYKHINRKKIEKLLLKDNPSIKR